MAEAPTEKRPKDLFVFDELSDTLSTLELKPGETEWRMVQEYGSILHGNLCTFSAVAAMDKIYALIWRKWFFVISPYSESPTWGQLESFRDGHGPCPPAAAIGEAVYVCGGGWKESEICYVDGWEMKKFSERCEKFDSETGGWSYIADLKTPRRLNSVVNASGSLYCIGGLGAYSPEDKVDSFLEWGKGKELDLVEKYDPATNEWIAMANMKTPRVSPAVTAYKQSIYALGGGYRNSWLQSVEFCDIQSNTWTELRQNMLYKRIKFTAFVVKKHLYAIGGDRTPARGEEDLLRTQFPPSLPISLLKQRTYTGEKMRIRDETEEWREIEYLLQKKEINGMATVIMKRPSRN